MRNEKKKKNKSRNVVRGGAVLEVGSPFAEIFILFYYY